MRLRLTWRVESVGQTRAARAGKQGRAAESPTHVILGIGVVARKAWAAVTEYGGHQGRVRAGGEEVAGNPCVSDAPICRANKTCLPVRIRHRLSTWPPWFRSSEGVEPCLIASGLTKLPTVKTSGDGAAWKLVYLTPLHVLYSDSGEHFHPANSLKRRVFPLSSCVNQITATNHHPKRDSSRIFTG